MKIEKYNEFVNNDNLLILKLIEESEMTNFPDLELISQTNSYKQVVSYGKEVIPFLLERNSIIWDKALSEITGYGLKSLEYNTSERVNYWKKWAKENG